MEQSDIDSSEDDEKMVEIQKKVETKKKVTRQKRNPGHTKGEKSKIANSSNLSATKSTHCNEKTMQHKGNLGKERRQK